MREDLTYQVCKMVPEVCEKRIPYTVCKMVPEQRVKTCTYQVCKMVSEVCEKRIPYTVARWCRNSGEDLHLPGLQDGLRGLRERIPYTVCKMVPEQRVKTCTYQVCKMVAEQRVKTAPTRSARWCPSKS